jgi:hypothetical protein
MMAVLETPIGRMNIYDDSNHEELITFADKNGFKRAAQPRDYGRHPFGSLPFATFSFPKIDRSELPERIKEAHAKKTFSLYHHMARKVPILNQKNTNYCWANAPTGALMSARARAGLPVIKLSAASFAGPGKKFQNVGGWGGEAIGYMAQFGCAPDSLWPNAEINRKFYDGTRQVAEHFNIGQWYELNARDANDIIAAVLFGMEVCIGLPWWSHEVYLNALYWEKSLFANVVNSWDVTWETNGMTVMAEEKFVPGAQGEALAVSTVLMDGWQHDLKRIAHWSEGLAV